MTGRQDPDEGAGGRAWSPAVSITSPLLLTEEPSIAQHSTRVAANPT
jgi:hypothetical protein